MPSVIIAQLIGGLGNQLFQYAAARRLAIEKGIPLKLDISWFEVYPMRTYKLSHFNIKADIAAPAERDYFTRPTLVGKLTRLFERKLLPPSRRHIFKERRPYVFDPNFLTLQNRVLLQGYFQNIHYFQPIEAQLQDELRITTPIDAVNQSFVEHIQSVNAVSLHIRRGDYVSNPEARAFHGVLPLDYYHAAAAAIAREGKDEPHFFVFSDDVAWAKEHLSLPHPMTFIDHNQEGRDYEDLRLLSTCKHHIIANSSFSWWGAWLSHSRDKIVYAPKHWTSGVDIDPQSFSPKTWRFL